jgi:putative redox protein
MKVMNATVTWSGNMSFTGHPPSGHPVLMDASLDVGGGDTAARPSELLLLGLGGCTGMDLISILRKMRQTVTSLEIDVAADQDEDYPRRFLSIRLAYRIRGRDLDEESVRRAIQLSEEKYCSVAATLSHPVTITWSLEIAAE